MSDAKSKPAKPTVKPTRYEISERVGGNSIVGGQTPNVEPISWKPAATVEANGAHAALRQYVDGLGDKFTGGTLRAVPVSNITQVTAKIETQRKLTLA